VSKLKSGQDIPHSCKGAFEPPCNYCGQDHSVLDCQHTPKEKTMKEIDEDEWNRTCQEHYFGGRAQSMEELEAELRNRAGRSYAAGEDDLAKWYRELSIFVGKKALDERKRQKDFSPRFSGGV
jgi:hypothetical protein